MLGWKIAGGNFGSFRFFNIDLFCSTYLLFAPTESINRFRFTEPFSRFLVDIYVGDIRRSFADS